MQDTDTIQYQQYKFGESFDKEEAETKKRAMNLWNAIQLPLYADLKRICGLKERNEKLIYVETTFNTHQHKFIDQHKNLS